MDIETAAVNLERNISYTHREKLINDDGLWYLERKGVKYIVPTIEQADDLGIKYIDYDYWYTARKGDWIATADGYVVEVLRYNGNPKFSYIGTIFGTYTVGADKNIRYHFRRGEPNTERRTRPNVIGGNQIARNGILSKQQRHFVFLAAHSIAQKGEVDWWATAKAAFPNRKFIHRLDLSRLINSPKIQEAILTTISQILKQEGADANWAIRGIMALAEAANTPPALRFKIFQEVLFLEGHMTSDIATQLPQIYVRMQMQKDAKKIDVFTDEALAELEEEKDDQN
jgi:hypothetical protein